MGGKFLVLALSSEILLALMVELLRWNYWPATVNIWKEVWHWFPTLALRVNLGVHINKILPNHLKITNVNSKTDVESYSVH